MLKSTVGVVFAIAVSAAVAAAPAHWTAPRSPVVPEADGYVVIPAAAMRPTAATRYRAVFDATRAADKPSQLVPGLNMLASELNALGAEGAPLGNAKFVVVFHGAAMGGLLDDAHYRAANHVPNPNLAAMHALRKAGVELYVCGQNLAYENIDPRTLTPDVTIASDALLVLMTYQNRGYALMSF